jgi:iron complex outermembrane receptor protein
VEIIGLTPEGKPSGYRTTEIDSSQIADYSGRTLADLIADNTVIYIKTYGSGGLATPSFRGTGAGHTQIAWNGISLNNPMSAQYDLSLVPAGLIDEITVMHGAGAMHRTSGFSGGVVDMETKPEWNGENTISLNISAGSFGNYSGLLRAKAGNEKFQSLTRAFTGNSRNDFSYFNNVAGPGAIWERRKNNEVDQKGFIQELHIRDSRNTLSARIWYQSASRNLPSPIIIPDSDPPEKQEDESLRAMIGYSRDEGASEFGITAAMISDRLLYVNELASIKSSNRVSRFILRGDSRLRVGKRTEIGFLLGNELTKVLTNNYGENRIRNIGSFGMKAETALSSWLKTGALLRGFLLNEKLLTPDFSISAEITPVSGRDYALKANFSRNSKIPSLNDMYWYPGGNENLKNENGYLSEISWEMNSDLSPSVKLENEITFFRNHLENMIAWRPGEYSYWVARNEGVVNTSGIEASAGIFLTFGSFSADLRSSYSYTKAVRELANGISEDPGNSRQIPYIPKNQNNTVLRIKWKSFYSSIMSCYTGRRYLTEDNSSSLPGYFVSDLSLGVRLKHSNTRYNLLFTAANIFDAGYQNMAYYPLPGRNYRVSLNFQFNL